MRFKLLWENLENFTKEELCDIYWNLMDDVWDRRIGRKPRNFDNLPNKSTIFKKETKQSWLEPYIKKIEQLTTKKDRRKYLMVVVYKCLSESDFEKWWLEIGSLM